MQFPDISLVKLAPRDLTGPGVEFYARRLSVLAATAGISATLPADQTSFERMYMLNVAFSLIPGAAQSADQFRLYLQLPTIDMLIFNAGAPGIVNDLRREFFSPSPIVIPGGKALLAVGQFTGAVNANSFDGWLWGYSFPKGNVLSF